MNYRLIFKDLLLELTNKEAYTFCCILLNSDKNTYISHIKQKTLSEMTGYSERTIKAYIKKFEEVGLLKIEPERIEGEKGYFNRNTYHVLKPVTNYFRVEYDFLLENLSSDIKGYILLLKCICYAGSNTTLYSLNEIGKKKLLQIGLSTIKKLNREAVPLGVILPNKTGYTITTPNIYADTNKTAIPVDSPYMDYYNQIVHYCKSLGINPPKYEGELMKIIFYNCPNFILFKNLMANRRINEINIYSLSYFIKVLNLKYPKKLKQEDYVFIM